MSWLLGKDRNWDLFNYHLYAPHLLLHGRLDIDFMGGGPQSYLNPVAYLPLYLSVVSNWPDWAVGAMLATLHSLNLLLVWHIAANQLFVQDPDRTQKATLSVLLAASSPVFLGTLGSTFSDPITSIFVLAGLAALLPQHRPDAWKPRLIAGGCIGIACGLKLSNFPFLVAAACATLMVSGDWRNRLAGLGCLLAGVLAGGILVNGWWAWRLYEQFGNPVFPLLNEVFRSADFPAVPIRPDRFIPHDWMEFLLFPFRMASSHSWIYAENSAPDVRPAVLVLVATVGLIGRRFWGGASESAIPSAQSAGGSLRPWVFFLVATFIWLAGSGNGRYVIPLLLLLGPLGVALMDKCISTRQLRRIACAVLILIQCWVLLQSGNPRWGWVPWGGPWVRVNPPVEQIREPHGYLSFGQNSASFIAPFVNRESGFFAAHGIVPLRPGGPGEMRVRNFINRYPDRLVMLFRSAASAEEISEFPDSLVAELSLWGLGVDETKCRLIAASEWPGGLNTLGCPLFVGALPDAAFAEQVRKMTAVFDKVAAACPTRFDPPDWPLVKEGTLWLRRHVNTDTVVFLRNGRFYASRYDFGPWDEDLGSFADWQAGTQHQISCARPVPHYLVKP
ncbi:MAG: hypothetical protein JNM76_09515 [Betaproteobacteria bacterium]|nr:hypothetical protein [Betaproteobacteria bacterium]